MLVIKIIYRRFKLFTIRVWDVNYIDVDVNKYNDHFILENTYIINSSIYP